MHSVTDGDLPHISGRALYRALPEVHLNLSEVFHAREEDALFLVAGDVLADVGVPGAEGAVEDRGINSKRVFTGYYSGDHPAGDQGQQYGRTPDQPGLQYGDLGSLGDME